MNQFNKTVKNETYPYHSIKEIKNEYEQKDRKNGRVPVSDLHRNFHFRRCAWSFQAYCIGRCCDNRQEYHGICMAIPDRLCGRSGWCGAFPFDSLGFIRIATASQQELRFAVPVIESWRCRGMVF